MQTAVDPTSIPFSRIIMQGPEPIPASTRIRHLSAHAEYENMERSVLAPSHLNRKRDAVLLVLYFLSLLTFCPPLALGSWTCLQQIFMLKYLETAHDLQIFS